MENLDLGGTVDQSYIGRKDFTTQSGGVSSNIYQLCVIITEAAEENDDIDNIATYKQGDKSRSNSKKEKEKNPRLHRRVENYYVSHQSRHGGTRQFKKRSLDGVSVCPAPAQKEATGGKGRVQEKLRKQ
jgi:hypothetical protein